MFPMLCAFLAVTACAGPAPSVTLAEAGSPLPQLEAGLLEEFEQGRTLFDSDFTAESGLGPAFNQSRCSSCHDVPVLGGGGVEVARKATAFVGGRCDKLEAHGGPMFQSGVTSAAQVAGGVRETIPLQATHQVDLNAPALFGAGLIESIAFADIASKEDPNDDDGDGVSGRLVMKPSGQAGRFGLKAEHASIRSFVTEALVSEMGVTTSDHPEDPPIGLLVFDDEVPDPEVSDADVELLVRYVSLLAAVGSREVSDPDSVRTVQAGAALFETTGCATCHTPFHIAGPEAPAGTSGQPFPVYSDFLLHDLGPAVAGHCTEDALPTEWRTAPLAGLRHRVALFHDGREQSVERAIARHGGEASLALARYNALDAEDRARLHLFLSTL